MDFYDRLGIGALGSRLRRLGERLADDAARVYPLYGTQLQPRWFPVFQLLSERQEESVSAIAAEIGQSHASVSQIVAEMVRADYAVLEKGTTDKRITLVRLTPSGQEAIARFKSQWSDVESAARQLIQDSGHDLWAAIAACEKALDASSLYDRIQTRRKLRESEKIVVRDFQPRDAKAFKALNEEWVKKYFRMEEFDYRILNDPQGEVLDKDGAILVAVDGRRTVGVCALLPRESGSLELTKLAVSPNVHGKGIGRLVVQAAIEKAREMGASRLYLESNTILEAAISLYRKVGFRELHDAVSHYDRCNIIMEMELATDATNSSPV